MYSVDIFYDPRPPNKSREEPISASVLNNFQSWRWNNVLHVSLYQRVKSTSYLFALSILPQTNCKARLYRVRPRMRTRRISNLYESVYTEGDQERGWKLVRAESRGDCLQSEFLSRRWSHELFLVNQSVLLFSCNSAQVTRGTRKKCDCSAPVDNMSDKTELLIVEVEKHPILIRQKGQRKRKMRGNLLRSV